MAKTPRIDPMDPSYELNMLDVPIEEFDLATLSDRLQEATNEHNDLPPRSIRITKEQSTYMAAERQWRTYKSIHIEVEPE